MAVAKCVWKASMHLEVLLQHIQAVEDLDEDSDDGSSDKNSDVLE